MTLPISFQASVIPGKGRGGSEVGFPTINVNLADVPLELKEGIFACKIKIENNETNFMGAMHYGPRIVFNGTISCEIHIIDTVIEQTPSNAEISVIEFLREIQNFDSVEELRKQIQKDIDDCKAILKAK